MCYGKSFMRDSESCLDCRKSDGVKTYNACRKELFSKLRNDKNIDNDDVIRMTLDDTDWEFYCKKIIKRYPKTQSKYQQNIKGSRRGRKTKNTDDGSFSAMRAVKLAKVTPTKKPEMKYKQKLSPKRIAFIKAIRVLFTRSATITRAQIDTVVKSDKDIKWPYWLTSNKDLQVSRGVFYLPDFNGDIQCKVEAGTTDVDLGKFLTGK